MKSKNSKQNNSNSNNKNNTQQKQQPASNQTKIVDIEEGKEFVMPTQYVTMIKVEKYTGVPLIDRDAEKKMATITCKYESGPSKGATVSFVANRDLLVTCKRELKWYEKLLKKVW